jgi:hypothetical protein
VAIPGTADGLHGASAPLRLMEIGDLVLYQGQEYVLLGFDPMSVPDRCAELERPETGERLWVPFAEVEERA